MEKSGQRMKASSSPRIQKMWLWVNSEISARPPRSPSAPVGPVRHALGQGVEPEVEIADHEHRRQQEHDDDVEQDVGLAGAVMKTGRSSMATVSAGGVVARSCAEQRTGTKMNGVARHSRAASDIRTGLIETFPSRRSDGPHSDLRGRPQTDRQAPAALQQFTSLLASFFQGLQ